MKQFSWAALSLLVLAGCYPYPDNNAIREDLDIAVTAFKDSVDFSAYRTYVLYDSVQLIVDEGETVNPDDPFYANGIDQVILNEIEKQMDALGYTRVTILSADLLVSATALRVKNVNSTGFPGWWWGFPGYGVPGFGGGAPAYWNPTFYSYETGSVVIDMRDLSISDADETFVWNAFINGLLGETTTPESERVRRAVEASFLQSRNFYPREEEQ